MNMKNLKLFSLLLVIMFVLITPVKVKAAAVECPDCDALLEAYGQAALNVTAIGDLLSQAYTALGYCYINPNEDPGPCIDWWSAYISDLSVLYDAFYIEYAAAAEAYGSSGCP